MTDQDIIKACAELDGWNPCYKTDSLGFPPHLNPNRDCPQVYKPYLTSRDAIIPVIERQQLNGPFLGMLVAVLGLAPEEETDDFEEHTMQILLSTPAQLCEALLRATGKWVE